MCLATPLQIKSIKTGTATVEHGGKDFPVSLQLIPQAKVGDWVLAHGKKSNNIIPEHEALDILKLIQKANES